MRRLSEDQRPKRKQTTAERSARLSSTDDDHRLGKRQEEEAMSIARPKPSNTDLTNAGGTIDRLKSDEDEKGAGSESEERRTELMADVSEMGHRQRSDDIREYLGAAGTAFNSSSDRKRTKVGCSTCRKRGIKCGEERPACQNCVRSGWYCVGYSRRVVLEPAQGRSAAREALKPEDVIMWSGSRDESPQLGPALPETEHRDRLNMRKSEDDAAASPHKGLKIVEMNAILRESNQKRLLYSTALNQLKHGNEANELPIWAVQRATSAAPRYFVSLSEN
jgi:hypothetical protein